MEYKIKNLNEITVVKNLLREDENNRQINLYELQDVVFVGRGMVYPNILAFSDNNVYNIIDEQIMSLKLLDKDKTIEIKQPKILRTINTPVFYFIYNTDNYYHFIYDTLPYIISYRKIKEKNPNIKLLISYPNQNKREIYSFVLEFLELLGIAQSELIHVDPNTRYSLVYISNSYTHSNNSDNPPRKEIYSLYREIADSVKEVYDLPERFYVSRRSWIHGDYSNIGTNYTSRRLLVNEDQVVEVLKEKNIKEIFTEKLTTREKIFLFKNAKIVVGAIGGGLCNVLFSSKECNLISLNSPTFLDINKRFLHSFTEVSYIPFNYTYHSENTFYKKFMRVRIGNIVGEISNIENDHIIVKYTDTPVAGWSGDISYKTKKIDINESGIKLLDNGLNSPWYLDIEKLKKLIKTYEKH